MPATRKPDGPTDVVAVDPGDLTLGEVETFEEMSGVSLAEVGSGRVTGKALTALVFLTGRRGNPDYTVEDARAVKVSQVAYAEEPENPTQAAD